MLLTRLLIDETMDDVLLFGVDIFASSVIFPLYLESLPALIDCSQSSSLIAQSRHVLTFSLMLDNLVSHLLQRSQVVILIYSKILTNDDD